MRNHIVKTGLVALAFAPLLAACGQENSGGGGGFVTVPSCGQNGQVLSTDSSGQLICKDLPTGTVTVPNCDPDLKALTSDGKSLFCADRNTVDANTSSALIKLQQLEKDVTTYNNIINMLGTGSSARARYVGSTTAMTTGRITSGAQVGVAAATAMCDTQYKGARMCDVYDMYYSAATGAITQATQLPATGSWVYMEAWKQPPTSNTSQEPLAGITENCAGYIYGTGDRGWVGTLVKWETTTLNANDKSLKFYTGSADAACSLNRPVACCK